MPPGRQDWVDAAKGFAIVAVVVGHSWRGLHARGLVPPELFAEIDQRLYAFHMPIFFALSGLFFARSLANASPLAFVTGRLTRLIWPMVLWLYVFLAFKAVAGARANTPVTWSDLLVWPIPGQLHLWFLWALFLLHMVFLASRPLIRDGRYSAWSLVFFVLAALVVALSPKPSEIERWFGDAMRNAPFFVLGLALAQSDVLARIGGGLRIGAALIFVAVLVAWPPETNWLQLAGSLALTFCALTVLSGIGREATSWPARWLVTLGVASMAIYLMHTIFSAALREALLVLGHRDLLLHLVPSVLVGILAPLIVLAAARRLGAARILGF